jgi:putative ATPase
MTDLFERAMEKRPIGVPLADLCRPESIDDVQGQEHLLGKGMVLREAIERGEIFSMILWGPPGSGKTTVAGVIAKSTGHIFVSFSAVMGGVKEVRDIVQKAGEEKKHTRRGTILFVDEIHRFNKIQQDAFLPHVEKGTITLIGATTENPSFALNSPLLSRCRVLLLRPLGEGEIEKIITRVIRVVEQKSGMKIEMEAGLATAVARAAEGDARRAINTLEIVLKAAAGTIWEADGGPEKAGKGKVEIGKEDLEKVLGKDSFLYDRSGEEHYNTISAFIKSLRGSDPDAAVYYMARMLEGGEDPLYILRRMMIFAAEDIGLADPQALQVAAAAAAVFERLGLPEGVLPMTEAALYLATAPKSNSVITTINRARTAVQEKGPLGIPMHLRNPVTTLMKEMGYGKDYRYPHNAPGHWVPEQYLPEELKGSVFYIPSSIGYEKTIAQRLEKIREYMKSSKKDGED